MKRIGRFLLDLLEIYLPAASFCCLFIAFIVQVVYRYFLDNPLLWPEEIALLGFIWTTLLAAGYIRRINGHIEFNFIYDKLSAPLQRVSRLIANTVVLVAFALPLHSILEYIQALNIEKTTALRIPLSIGYAPVAIFFVLIIGHTLHDIIADLRAAPKQP